MPENDAGGDPTDTTNADTTNTDAEDTGSQDQDQALGDAGKRAIAKERAARKEAADALKAANSKAADLEAKLKAYEDRDKTDAEKAAERIAELERTVAEKDSALTAKEIAATRASVAADKGVPVALVTGSTRDEMEAAADAALEWRGDDAGKSSIAQLRQKGFQSGATSGADGTTVKQKAAQALRQLRAGQ